MSKRGGSSGRWLERQRRDRFVRRAQQEGTVSRAHYKLEQLDRKYRLTGPGHLVLELGAAPGGWTRYLAERIPHGLIIAVDPLPVAAGATVQVLNGLFGEEDVELQIRNLLAGRRVDLVLSDMAPNLSGIRAADQARAIHLADLTLSAAETWLKPDGAMVVKVFHGEGLDGWLASVRRVFSSVRLVKPEASRQESREAYAVALGFRATHQGE